MEELNLQLNQLYRALAGANETDQAGIQKLIQDLEELIELSSGISSSVLSEENDPQIQGTETSSSSSNNAETELDPDDEFAKFQKEISSLGNASTELEDSTQASRQGSSGEDSSELGKAGDEPVNLSELLSSLEGMKCRAPYEHSWGQAGYHNGIVFSVEPILNDSTSNADEGIDSLESVAVRVVFAQPVSGKMRPCQFFLEGRCRFEEEECKFSHGELVGLSELKDYSEPNFAAIGSGTRILAKYSDELWYNATVSKLTDSGECEITFDSYNEKATVPLCDTFPLDKGDEDEDLSLCSDDDSDSDNNSDSDVQIVEQSDEVWNHMNGTSALGQWEKHTKGIGSKLMQRMGYVLGTGLGKEGEGRVDPIDAVILPPGRSLDKCMELKEKAGSAGANLFSVEKRLKRIQRKEKLRAEQQQEKAAKTKSVFNFLNKHLNLSKNSSDVKKSKAQVQLNKESGVNLNLKLLKIGEDIKQAKKDISKCKEAMKRHEGRDQSTVEKMKLKLNSLQSTLSDLERSEVNVTSEQRNRSDKKKLVVF